MIFWDTSAVVPLVVEEAMSGAATALLRADPAIVVWWATEVKCLSALARRERDGGMAVAEAELARRALRRLRESWAEVLPSEEVRERAEYLLLRQPKRASDALQLAAALTWAGGRPRARAFCALDARLVSAARAEGFDVPLEPTTGS